MMIYSCGVEVCQRFAKRGAEKSPADRSTARRVLSAWLLGAMLLLAANAATAQNYLLRYVNTASGAITFCGNTLGLAKASGQNNPGTYDSIGCFVTLNTNSQAGTYALGTTLNWSNNSSMAVLRLPTNSTVLYAELIWAGSAQIASDTTPAGNVLSDLGTPVQFILPNGTTNLVAPDPVTATLVTNGTSAIFYVNSANVTALVQGAGAGNYAAGGVPGTALASEDANNACGWTLAVVYGNASLHPRNLSLFIGNSFAISGGPAPNPISVSGFCAPPVGPVHGRLYVSAVEGDPNKTGDQMKFGPTTNTLVALSGTNNLVNNFFASQINGDNGLLDTSGTFGLSNSTPGAVTFSARQGWDITSVDLSGALTNGLTSAYAQNVTSGDGYSVNALALQIDVGSPVLTTLQTVDKGSTYVGDVLTYTVAVTNSGTADAVNLIFTDPLPFGTSFIGGTFATNGVIIAGANPVNGVPVADIPQNSSLTFTYQVTVDQIPPSARFVTAATINFQYAGTCAQSPIINSTLVNAQVQTLVPLLNISKIAGLTNVIPGATFTYTINVPNIGTTNTTGAMLYDPLPVGVSYVTNSTTLNGVMLPDINGTNMPYTVATEIHGPGRLAGVIDVGDTAVVTFQVTISQTPPPRINNTATIFADGIAPTTAQNAAVNITPIYADLAAGIVSSTNPFTAGADVSYTVSITNFGPDDIGLATNYITLYLPLPNNLLSPVYTPSSGSYDALNGVWSGITLGSNNVVTLGIYGQVAPGTAAGTMTAAVTVTPPPGVIDLVTNNNSASVTNSVIQSADLALTLSDGVTNVGAGEVLSYVATVVNLGPSTISSVTLSNLISSSLTNVTEAAQQGNFNHANGVWDGLNLTPGSAVTLMIQASVPTNATGFITNSATVFPPAGVTDPVYANNTAVDIDQLQTTPDVAILKYGPPAINPGGTFNYTLIVTNYGYATASNIVASDVLPPTETFAGATGGGTNTAGTITWNFPALAAAAGTNVTLTVTAPGNGSLTNIATVSSTTVDFNPANNTNPPVITLIMPLADLQIGKTGPAAVLAASNLVYTISVTNAGPSTANSVTVTDALPAAATFVSASGGGTTNGGVVTWNVGTLSSNQVTNVTVTVTAPLNGTLVNVASAGSPVSDPNLTNNVTLPVVTAVTPVADLAIVKSGPASVLADSNFSYTITVTNLGPSTAGSVVVTDALPVGVTFVGAGAGGTKSGTNVIWNLGTLAAAEVTNFTVTVTSPANPVTLTNVASVWSPAVDTNLSNNATPPVITTVIPVADVGLGKIGAATVFAASNLTYTVSVTNFGPSSATGVLVTDALPAGVVFVNASGKGSNVAGVVTWNVGTLSSNQVTNVTVTVTAPAGGSLTNVASAGSPVGDPNLTNNVTLPVITAVTPVADVAIAKSGPAAVLADSNFSYTITVTNLGPSSTASVVVTDALPAGVTFVGASGGGTSTGANVIWNLGSLVGSQATNLTLTVTAPVNGATLTNVASVGSPVSDPNLTNNVTLPVVTAVTPVADLAIVKSGPASVLADSNFSYTITVTNLGPSTAGSVVVTDALPAGVTFVGAGAGGTKSGTNVIWNLGTLAAAQVTNFTVTVTSPANPVTLTNVASVWSPAVDTNLSNNATPPVITTVIPVADVGLGKTGPASVLAASNLVYTISVTNFGPSSASGVLVTDTLPAGVLFVIASSAGSNVASVVTWNVGTLSSNQVTNVTVTVTAPAGGSLTNVASAGSPVGDPNLTNNVTPPVVTAVTPVADLAIAKSGPASVLADSNFSYTITVMNLGPSTAASVVVTDALPVGVTFASASAGGTNTGANVIWNLGSLAVSQATNLTLTVTAPVNGATLTNVASVVSPTLDPVLTNNVTPPVVTAVIPVADVIIAKTGPAGALFGTNYGYTITVSNAGPSAATGLVVTDSLPAGLVLVTSSPLAATNAGNQVIWNLGGIAAGATSNLSLTVSSTQRGSLTNIASVGGPTLDPVPTNNVTRPVVTSVTNYPPLANPDAQAMTENTTGLFSPLTNDVVRTPGGVLTIIGVSTTNGTASVLNSTNVSFTPTNNYIGLVTLTYTITDNVGGTNSSTLAVDVTNIPPIANPDSYGMTENTTNTFSPTANDQVFTPGGTFNLVSVSTTNGTATVSGTNVIFTPATNFIGVTVLNYTLSDGVGGTNSSTITVNVTNLPPLAGPDFYRMAENTTNTFSPLTNDVVLTPGGSLDIVSLSPTNGTATVTGGTNVTFIPTTGFVGMATIGYTITDNVGGTNTSLITVTVTNQSPLAFAQSVATTENTALPLTLTGSDPANHPLTFIILAGPAHGTLSALNTNTGAATYLPTNNFTGTDTFLFRVNNGFNNSSNATVTISVTPVADLLVQQSGPAAGVAGSNLVFTVAVTNLGPASATNVVVTNQIDPGFTFVSASAGGGTNGDLVLWTIPVLPPGGNTNLTVTLFAVEGGTYTNIASGISATPDLDATNNNGSLTNAQAVTAVSALADVAVFKTGDTNVSAGGAVNYAITATNFGPSTAANVVVQDRLPAGATLQAASGDYVLSNNVIVWSAADLAGGAMTNFTVTLSAPAAGALTNIALSTSDTPDGSTNNNNGTSSNSIVTTTVTPVADLAAGKTGLAATCLGTNFVYAISVTNLGPSVAANFSVTDSLPVGIAFVSASPAAITNAAGQVIWNNLGALASNAVANLTVTVHAVTRTVVTNIATVGGPTSDPNPANNASPPVVTSITNRPPLAVNDFASTPENVAVTIPALANDSDPDGDPLTIISVSPTNGLASINGTNVVFTPAGNFIGAGYVAYTIIDGFGGTNSALITINVTNRPPVANGQSVTTPYNTPKPITLTGTDPGGYPLTFVIVNPPADGVLSLVDTNAGTLTYTPTNNFSGDDAFTFLVNDGLTNSAAATVNIVVGAAVTADLAVFKTGPAGGVAGSNLVYTITVTNLGPNAATNVLVSDQLPAGFTLAGTVPANATLSGNAVNWAAFILAAHAQTNFTVTAFAAEGGTYTNIASATSDAFDPNPTNNNGTATNSQARTVVSALADVQVFKTGGTNVTAGGTANYTITVTNSGPSTATNVVVQDTLPAGTTFQTASGSYAVSNNVVTWAALVLTNGASTNFTIALTAPLAGSFTNIALATSGTPDPNPTNNNGSYGKSRVTTKIVPAADLVVLLFGPPNAVLGSNYVYSLILSNAGPSMASNAVASDLLPPNLVFVSASSGGALSNGLVTWPNVAALPVDGTTNYLLTVYSSVVGTVTNTASATAATFDPDPTNNTGVLPASQVQTMVTFAQFSWLAGAPLFNPQTGLYEETVLVTNTGNGTVAGFQLYVTVLTTNVYLWNATGTNVAGAYVQYGFPLDPSNHVSLALEFYDPYRVAFTNTLRVVPVIPGGGGTVGTNGSVSVAKVFTDNRTSPPRFVIEFASVPGKTYAIIYSGDMVTWLVATPSVTANANVTQWYDDGPPKTVSPPLTTTNRFYRVIQY